MPLRHLFGSVAPHRFTRSSKVTPHHDVAVPSAPFVKPMEYSTRLARSHRVLKRTHALGGRFRLRGAGVTGALHSSHGGRAGPVTSDEMMPQDLERQATSKPSAKANKQNQVAPTNRRMQSRARHQLNSRHAIQR
jgi:hypothetical protein